MDWIEESALVESATKWAAEVRAAYADGGYAAGDGPSAPLDEVSYLLDFRREALAKIDRLHRQLDRLGRMADANPAMRIADALVAIDLPSSGE